MIAHIALFTATFVAAAAAALALASPTASAASPGKAAPTPLVQKWEPPSGLPYGR